MSVTSKVATRNYSVDPLAGKGTLVRAENLGRYLQPSDLLPTDGIVKNTADQITKGAKTDVDKARALYEGIVDNTYRDPRCAAAAWAMSNSCWKISLSAANAAI